jgi:hypothetical protein
MDLNDRFMAIIFGALAEIGGNKIQQTGLYNGTVEITAATL